jgi:hypothetical protein
LRKLNDKKMNEEKENELDEIDEEIILALHNFGPLTFEELDSYINKEIENKLIKYFERKLGLIIDYFYNSFPKYFKSSKYSSYFYKITKYYISLIYIRIIQFNRINLKHKEIKYYIRIIKALWKLTEGKEDIIFHQRFDFNEAIEEIINELNKKRLKSKDIIDKEFYDFLAEKIGNSKNELFKYFYDLSNNKFNMKIIFMKIKKYLLEIFNKDFAKEIINILIIKIKEKFKEKGFITSIIGLSLALIGYLLSFKLIMNGLIEFIFGISSLIFALLTFKFSDFLKGKIEIIIALITMYFSFALLFLGMILYVYL